MTSIQDSRHTVLVMDANAIGMVGVIRSLGSTGYIVHAAAGQPHALGLHSRFASAAVCCPSYETKDFLPWLDRYIEEENIEAIFPSEGFLHAITDDYNHYRHLLPDAVSLETWQRCLSKVASHERITAKTPAEKLHLPQAGVIRDETTIPRHETLKRLGGPFFLKADVGLSLDEPEAHVVRCENAEELVDKIHELLPRYSALLWQQFVPGRKVGVSLWRHRGKILAENMTLGIHMNPWTGGMMSLRKSFWHEALLADARAKIELLEWEGVAMMEYKWNPETDEFWFIEINARYWGYLHLDLYTGKDFPRLQADAYFGRQQTDLGPPGKQATSRHTVPGEIGYVMSRLRSEKLGPVQKAASILGFCLRFFDVRVKSDLWFPGDRALYFLEWRNFIRQCFR